MNNPSSADVQWARDAALIVNFYGPRQERGEGYLPALLTTLITHLSLEPSNVKENWQNLTPAREIFLRRFEPPAAPDSTVLQLALNEPGTVEQAWDALRQCLEQVLEKNSTESVWDHLWGYSLFYQAEIDMPPSNSNSNIREAELVQVVRRPFAPQGTSTSVHSLTRCDVPDGCICLVDIPIGDRKASASIYVALSYPDTENRMITRYIYGPQALILMPDLIAHKGYHQARQFQLDEFHSMFANHLSTMQRDMYRLLHQMEEAQHRSSLLAKLAKEYSYLSEALSHLERLRVSIARQLHNFRWWLPRSQLNELLIYHRTFMENAQIELQLLLEEGHSALQAAGTTVEMVKARLESERQHQQEFLNTLLAVLAVALTVPQIMDREVIAAGLDVIGLLPANSSQQVLWLFVAQAGATLLLMIFAGLLVFLFMRIKSHVDDRT